LRLEIGDLRFGNATDYSPQRRRVIAEIRGENMVPKHSVFLCEPLRILCVSAVKKERSVHTLESTGQHIKSKIDYAQNCTTQTNKSCGEMASRGSQRTKSTLQNH
jgi:hypothetical protein